MKVTIVGGGVSGLFSAYVLLGAGFDVAVYEQTSGVAKKFLIAGNGGLNITHSEEVSVFASRYGQDEARFASLLEDFSPDDLRKWCEELGVETFVGTSGRVFPREMKAGTLFSAWLKHLKTYENFSLHTKHTLVNISKENELTFLHEGSEKKVKSETTILSLGGASWKSTGSDGLWTKALQPLGLELTPFTARNCGFNISWSSYFKEQFETAPLKNIALRFGGSEVKGEAMLTSYGIEGGAVYALSSLIVKQIERKNQAIVELDLKPSLTYEQVLKKISTDRKKNSLSNHLRKMLKLGSIEMKLLREVLTHEEMQNLETLATKVKRLPLVLLSERDIDEAISTAGGISFSNVDENLKLKQIDASIYIAGEMLDWDAPTGGYLLQGCFSMAHRVVESICELH